MLLIGQVPAGSRAPRLRVRILVALVLVALAVAYLALSENANIAVVQSFMRNLVRSIF